VIYKVSYVVVGSSHPGVIINQDTPPYIGERIQLGDHQLEVIEVIELLPPHGDFSYLHATCVPIREAA
jgi:hypothetical protein